jgi:four helix bundle protein
VGEVRSHRDLDVWQLSMDLAEMVYGLARTFPSSERYVLTNQLQRAVIAVPANIGEGRGRGTRRDYAHFVTIARGSLLETQTYILLAVRLGFVRQSDADPILDLISRIGMMINRLRKSLLDEAPDD